MISECSIFLTRPFPIRIENTHVVPASHIFVGVLPQGPNGGLLTSTFNRRENSQYLEELGETIIRICETTPDGVLCFFTSYGMMAKTIDSWKRVN
jgi:regulator of telomere elongation helicase 1